MPYHDGTTVDMTYAEVGAELGVSWQAIQKGERTALAKLRELLAGELDEFSAEPVRTIRAGRWNGKRIVRVTR